jgi:hypothetical protein
MQDLEDVNGATATSGLATGYNPFRWYPPSSVEMVYAGDIYARYDNGVGQLWNLINGNKSPAFDNLAIAGGGSAVTTSSILSQWLELPFAQTCVDEDSHYILVHGKPITNGIFTIGNQKCNV